ncbi:target of Nesh-SH3 isoform X7 [Ranitomeya imitator]|uniref:target of Nesh-SH3 isoform X7 n=1 Tax=Ranitomeya imitator TaxID=111125 RepID=UPI0037E89821
MISRISFLLFCGIILTDPGDAQKLPKVKKLNMKAHINITGDTLTMKFHRPNQNIKLEGFILGYGSNYFSNQYIQWPDNGKSYITDVDAETRYLIAVKPNENPKKSCKDKHSIQKPLQLVIGTLTPTSVFLSWGMLINPQIDWSALSKCPNGRFYTIRYREKNKDWNFQLCPTTETVIDNLKPNTLYEFGVTDNSEDGIWSKSQSHKTNPKGKENGNLENTYKIPKGTLQYATEDTKAFIPITKVKQGFQNITKPTPLPPVAKVTESPPVSKASEKFVVEESDLKPVTHPFFQVTNLPVESSATDEHTASLAITSQTFKQKQSTLPSPARTKIKTVFPGRQHISTTQDSNIKPADPYSILVPNETASFHPKPFPSTEAPSDEADSTQPNSEISITEAPHTYEQETFTLASNEKKVVQKFSSTSKPKPTTASKKTRVSPMQYKTPLPEKTHPTAVLKDMQPIQLIEETSTIEVPTEIQKLIPKKAHSTESPSLPVDPSTSHVLPIDDLGVDIFEHTKRPLEPNKTEKASTPKFDIATKSPTTSTVVTSEHIKPMPIYLISLQIFADPTVASEKTEIQTTPPPIPKTTQSNKMLHSKPVPNTTQRPYQPTTQKPESPPHSKPVPTQKVSTPTIKKPKPTPRIHEEPVPTQKVSTPTTKKPKPTPRIHEDPASTGAPKDTPKPSHGNQGTTLVPYRLQHSSSRPKTSFKPRTRPPAHNGTTQGPIRSRPTGEFNWLPGTVPGGKIHDNTKILGVRRNISMETNSTGKRTFSVSSPPLPPVRPTSIRRRIQPSNVTGRPGFSVSSPPLLPIRPTAIRRKPPTANVTGKPEKQGGNLIPRAPSAAKPECAVICIKSPMKQPTLPDQEEDLAPSTVFSTAPKSDIDVLGKTRYTKPHVLYMSKNDSVPCSITDTLKHFSTEEESTNQEVTSAPQNPPTNLTVYTVEGCSSFVVLNWEKPDNDTVTEYDVISKENGGLPGKDQSIITTNQTHSTVENLKPDTSYEFQVIPKNPLGEGPTSATVEFNTESADPRVSEPVTGGKDAIWTEIKFKADFYSDCKGKQYVKRTWYKKFVGIQLCNSLRYKIYLSDSLSGTFYNVGDQSGFGEDHCQFVDSFLEGRTGEQLQPYQLTAKKGFYRSVRQQPVEFGEIGGQTHISYVHWYECGISIPGKW